MRYLIKYCLERKYMFILTKENISRQLFIAKIIKINYQCVHCENKNHIKLENKRNKIIHKELIKTINIIDKLKSKPLKVREFRKYHIVEIFKKDNRKIMSEVELFKDNLFYYFSILKALNNQTQNKTIIKLEEMSKILRDNLYEIRTNELLEKTKAIDVNDNKLRKELFRLLLIRAFYSKCDFIMFITKQEKEILEN